MIDFNEKINKINNKQDFINFMELLILDIKNNEDEWVNNKLINYLEGISS